jgi:hypothetical protein
VLIANTSLLTTACPTGSDRANVANAQTGDSPWPPRRGKRVDENQRLQDLIATVKDQIAEAMVTEIQDHQNYDCLLPDKALDALKQHIIDSLEITLT